MKAASRAGGDTPQPNQKIYKFNNRLWMCRTCEVLLGDRKYLQNGGMEQ